LQPAKAQAAIWYAAALWLIASVAAPGSPAYVSDDGAAAALALPHATVGLAAPRLVRTNLFRGKVGEFWAPGIIYSGAERGRRRTRQGQISLGLKTAGEIADLMIRTVRRKTVSSAGPVFEKSKSLETTTGRLT
jgi:hypothetical protein